MVLNTGTLDWESSTLNTRPKSRADKIKNPKAFIDYSWLTDDVYETLEDYNLTKKRKVLTVFDMRAYIEANQMLSSIIIELFLRGRKIKNFICFHIKKFYSNSIFNPKTVRLKMTNYFSMKIPKKR